VTGAPPDDQVRAAVGAIERAVPADAIVAIYLYGSAMAGGLRPDSDIDVAVVTARRLTASEKEGLVDAIRPLSRRSLRPPDWRPLEVTVLALPDVRPWRYPPQLDAQYGEWLTDAELSEQARRGPSASPDAAVLITMLREASRSYVGPPAADVLLAVPERDLVRAAVDSIPALLADLDHDTRNVLLTLARMWVTVVTGTIRSKDEAAAWASERLPSDAAALLNEARALYATGGWGDWEATRVSGAASAMSAEIARAAEAR
jgi:predicted nucleotidyltransferase